MIVESKPYGQIEVDERQRIHFTYGLFGFEKLEDFVLMDARQRPFYWLQSLDVREIAFVLIDPWIFRPDYRPRLDPSDLEILGLAGEDDEKTLILTVVTVHDDRTGMTANLQGPVVINKESRQGRQCISSDDRWKVRHSILDEMASSRKDAC